MRSRPIKRWLIGVLVLVLLAGLGYALFPFLIDAEQYRRPLEARASFALGRRVTIKGPISLSLSLHPTLVLEDVHIANPSWSSRPDLLQASRLEAQLSFLELLRRELVINKVFFDGVDILLEEGPNESNNWTFGTPSDPSGSSQTKSPISATIAEAGFIGIQRVTIGYQPHMASGPKSQLTIIEGMVLSVEARTRQFSVRGMFRNTPFTIELKGGKIVDLVDLAEPWPFDGSITAAGSALNVKGHLIGPLSAPSLELTGALHGERLSDLNPLLDMDLPHYGPYELTTSLSLSEETISLSGIAAKIGESDFGGDLKLLIQAEKLLLSGKLTANTIQANDFRSSEPDITSNDTPIDSPDTPSSSGTFASQTGLDAIDIDLELAVNRLLYDATDLGTVAFSAKLKDGHLSLAPFQAKSFGGMISANLTLDGNHPAPIVTFDIKSQGLNYGQALQAFDVTSQIAGSSYLDIAIRGQGATLQEFLDHTTLSINAGPSSLMFGNEGNRDNVIFGIRQASVKVAPGETVKARLKGKFREKAIDVELVTGFLSELISPAKPWAISLLARTDDAVLTIKGGMRSEPEGMQVALAVSLSGQQLNRLDPNLPPSGPYVFRAQLINSGHHYFLNDLKGRLGHSDVVGSLSLNMEGDIPLLSAAFSSSYIDMADFSTPGDATPDDILIPVESLQALDADIKWEIKRMRAETIQLRDLTIDGSLKNGRLAFTTLKGNLFERKKTYAEFQGELTLDTTAAIPTLSGKTSVHNLDYGHLLQRFGRNVQLIGVGNLDAHFSSKGNTLSTMLAQPNFKIGTQALRVTLKDQQDKTEPFLYVSQATLSSKGGGPLLFSAEGSFKERPFTIASSAGALSQLIKDDQPWPLAIVVNFPQLSIDLKGHLLFPINSENITFQLSVKGDSSHDLSFIPKMGLSYLGPFTLTGQLTQIKDGYRLTELKGQWGPNDLAGHATFMTNGPRPKVVASLSSESNEIDFLTKELAPSTEPGPGRTIFKSIARAVAQIGTKSGESVAGIGSKASGVSTKSVGVEEKDNESDDGKKTGVARLIPDYEFPVDSLRAIDLDFDWEIQKVKRKGVLLGNLSYKLTLEDGLLKIGPLKGTLWHGTFDGKIKLDASQYVPTLTAQLTLEGLDVGFLDDTVGVTDMVKGNIDFIKLNLKSRGTTLHEVLNRANGEAEFVQGPFELTNKYLDAWAADIFTFTLTKAWGKEKVTKLNCMVGYFDITEGEIQSDSILFDTQNITVGGFGTLNLGTEQIDLILSPQPKTPTLATLAHPVRIHGHLSDPDVTSDKLRIAQGGGWYLLGLVSPIGLTIVIPKIAGTTIGTLKNNPCVEAMSSKEFTVQEVSELQEGFLKWMARKIKGVFTSNGDSPKAPPNSESGEP